MELDNCFNPLFRRKNVTELKNGWLFSIDNKTWQNINVPFCPQSVLSGIGYTDFIPQCYYKNTFTINNKSEKTVLHFGAVDFCATVFLNDNCVAVHKGGFTPFEVDISDYIHQGENQLFVIVKDGQKGDAFGKQSYKKNSFGCFYTRTTGIWQPVWLEFIPNKHIKEFYFYPNVSECSVDVDLSVVKEGNYDIQVLFDGKVVGNANGNVIYRAKITIPLSEKHLWEVGDGKLYDVIIRYENDEVYTYFGLREVCYNGYDLHLNGKRVYQKLVLEQGYNPQGIYTTPNIEFMKRDIQSALDLGFNGLRLHQKVFEPYYLYLCDKMGVMVWGEFPSWGIDYSNVNSIGQFLNEWQEVIKRDFNHPSIVTWCPLNEVWGEWDDPRWARDVKTVELVYNYTKTVDSTRPCVDTSGGHHCANTDLFDFHCYEPLDQIKAVLDRLENQDVLECNLLYNKEENIKYQKGMPCNLSECGGYAFTKQELLIETDTVSESAIQSEESWGYGKSETDGNKFVQRYVDLISLIKQYKKLSGFCYTQLYDVEQEQNGFYNYDRSDKLTEEQKQIIKRINDEIV